MDSIDKLVEAVKDPERRAEALKLIGSELGEGIVEAFTNFSNDPDYYGGYIAGTLAAGGAIGKLAKVASTAARLDKITDSIPGSSKSNTTKAKNKSDLETGGLPRPSPEDINLAKASGTTAAQIAVRKKVSIYFYMQQGIPLSKINSHISGIDFSKPVEVKRIKKGTRLTQYQIPGTRQGNYYAFPGSKATNLGISDVAKDRKTGKIVKKLENDYITTTDVDALSSTAAKIKDTWSIEGKEISTKGGGTQLFTTDTDSFSLEGDKWTTKK